MAPPERRAPRPEEISDKPYVDPVAAEVLGKFGSDDERPPRPPTLPAIIKSERPMLQLREPHDYEQRKDPFQVMDSWDDEVVIQELRGEAPRGKLVYKFKQQGKDVIGLGKQGVDYCCEILLHQGQVIRELAMRHSIIGTGTEQEALFQAKAGRFAVAPDGSEVKLDTVIGVKRQPLYQMVKATGEWVLNPHWFEQGSTKALRNARIRLLPIAIREEVMGMAQAAGRVQSNTQQKESDPRREASTDEQRKLYASMLASHHVKPEEREKALAWMAERRHSKAALTQQIDALKGLLDTRIEEERLAKTVPTV